MAENKDGAVLSCRQVPADTIQIHADPLNDSVWIETRTKYALNRTTVSLTRADALTLLNDLSDALGMPRP